MQDEKSINKPNQVSTPTVDSTVDMSTSASTPAVDSEKPIDKPIAKENGHVSTVSTSSENPEEVKEYTVANKERGDTGFGSYDFG